MSAPRLAPPSATPYLVAVVAGAMAFLAVCAVEAGSGAARLAGVWGDGLRGVATVRVPPDAQAQAAAVAGAVAALPGVTAARVMEADETNALLVPWLGGGVAPDSLPLPALIDVSLAVPPPETEAVQRAVEAVVPGAVYDDHAAWQVPVQRAAAAFRQFVVGAVALMGVALAAMVTVAARAGLAGAAGTVRTLRLLGARDGLIASSFDRGIALRATVGAAIGAPMAALALRALPLGPLGQALGGPGLAHPFPWPAVLGLPLLCGLLAYATARAAIVVMLRGTP